MRTFVCRAGFLILTFAIGSSFPGCSGGSSSTPAKPSPNASVASLRSTLEGYANSGVLDSGADFLMGDLDNIRGVAGIDIDALTKSCTELIHERTAAGVKQKAAAALKLLPTP